MTKLITPNWHVILIHYPMALLTLGVTIEFFSFLWRRSAFRAAGRWMILLGTLLAIPAVTTGIYAFRDSVSQEPGGTWVDVSSRTPGLSPAAWEMMRNHVLYMSIATGVFIIVVVTWLGSTDRLRSRLHIPLMLLLLVGTAILTKAAWHAGEAVYSESVAQQPRTPGRYPDMRNPTDESDGGLVTAPPKTPMQWIEFAAPPIQAHALSAGLVISFAVLALGLSIRKLSVGAFTGPPEAEDWFKATEPTSVTATAAPAAVTPAERLGVAPDPALPGIVHSSHLPASRFWMLAFVLALATMAGGLWVADNWTWPSIRGDFNDHPRDRWHIIFGVALVVLPLILAATTRWLSRSRLILALLTLMLALAIAGQLWMGVLLVYDGNHGPITRFTPPVTKAIHTMPAAVTPAAVAPPVTPATAPAATNP